MSLLYNASLFVQHVFAYIILVLHTENSVGTVNMMFSQIYEHILSLISPRYAPFHFVAPFSFKCFTPMKKLFSKIYQSHTSNTYGCWA